MTAIPALDPAWLKQARRIGRASTRSLGLRLGMVLLLCALGAPAGAADDPPGRVGRLSLVNGDVEAIVTAGADWEAATLNTPVSVATVLRTAMQSRAEVRVGSAGLQLNANTQLRTLALADEAWVLVLERGNMALSLRTLAAGERVEVQAGGASFRITAAGSYHFGHAVGASRFEVRVFAGAGQWLDGSPPLALSAGLQAQIDTRSMAVLAQGEAVPTRFDDWAAQRARRAERPALERYLSAEMTGGEDLDGHGRWRIDPRIGAIWYPNAVDADWAPYRTGRWLWVAPWGWSWVDQAPWGFAPFHYGRWLFLGGRWGWVPGRYIARPVYAPALVGFYGGAAAGAAPWVGWFPLAPGEPYRPGFATSGRYLSAINSALPGAPIAAPTSYRYAQTSFAATAVARDAFGNSRATADARVPLSPAALSMAGGLTMPGAPTPVSLAGKVPPAVVAPNISAGAEAKPGRRRTDADDPERPSGRHLPEQGAADASPKPHALRHRPLPAHGAGHPR